jgi:hypothetical protein
MAKSLSLAAASIVKGDIGIRDGRIVAVGKSGNPLTQDGVDPRLVIGPATEIIAGDGGVAYPAKLEPALHSDHPEQYGLGRKHARRHEQRVWGLHNWHLSRHASIRHAHPGGVV